MGTKAWEKAPSANIRRSRLGRRKATKKASVASPAPKVRAMTKSRTKPRMRDSRVMPLTVARARRRFIGDGGTTAKGLHDKPARCASAQEGGFPGQRSEEHTSELQSPKDLV